MGRNKRERRELNAKERGQAQTLKEQYTGLAEKVASRYYHEHQLGDQSWGGFDYGDILGVAYEGLCEAVLDYVEQHRLPRGLEKSYRAKSVELSEERECAYLATAIKNAIIDYVKHEDRIYSAREKLTAGGTTDAFKKPRFVPIDDETAGDDYDGIAEEVVDRETAEAEFAPFEIEAGEYQSPIDKLREFAETLPPQERAAFIEVLKDAENRRNRTPKEIAAALRVSKRYFSMLCRSFSEHLVAWHLKEYYGWAA